MAEPEPKIPPRESVTENVINDGSSLQLDLLLEQKIIARVQRDYMSSDTGRRSWIQKKKDSLNLLWGILHPKEFPFKNCANLNVPLLRTLLETLHSNLFESFEDRTPFDVIPVGPEDIVKASRTKKFLNWQFIQEIDFSALLDQILQFTLTYGHAICKIRYVKETKKVKRLATLDDGSQGVQEIDDTIFDGVKIDVVDPELVLFPANALTAEIDMWDYIIHEIPMTTSDIRRRQASGQFRQMKLPEPQSTIFSLNEPSLKRVRDLHIGTQVLEHSIRGGTDDNKVHRVLEWYGYYDIDEDGIEESILVTMLLSPGGLTTDGRSDRILRIVTWDMPRPFSLIRWSPLYNTPWGESVGDLVGKVNEELNTLHNQRVDSVTLANTPFGFYDPLSGFDPDAIELTPGLMLPVNGNPSMAVYFPPMQPIRPEMYREEELLMSYAERLVGAGANVQGAINPRNLTATEISTVDRRAGIRFFVIFKRIQKGLEEIARLVLEFDKRLMPPFKLIRIMGPSDFPLSDRIFDFDKFSREELQGRFDLEAIGESVMDEQANKQDQMMIYQLGMQNPLIAGDPDSIYNLTKDTLLALNAKNLASYLKKPQIKTPQDPELENDLMAQGNKVDPVIGENVPDHIQTHAEWINSEGFKLLPQEAQIEGMTHFQKTLKLQQLMLQMQQIQQARTNVGAQRAQLAAQQGNQNGATNPPQNPNQFGGPGLPGQNPGVGGGS